MGALGITGIIVFACGAFLGFLVTALAPIRPETWWLWPTVRVAWQAGGAVWAGWAIATAVGEYRAATIGGMAALGLVLCLNAALDLVRGPVDVSGTLVGAEFQRGALWRSTGRSPTLHGGLTIEGANGHRTTVKPAGLQANRLQTLLAECPSPEVRMQALRHLGVVMALHCEDERLSRSP